MKKLLSIAAAAAISTTAFAAPKAGAAKDTVYASGKIELDKKLSDKAKGIRTLYISIYDAASGMPRPYAATKIELPKDATSGAFHDFTLTPANIIAMGHGPAPQSMRIKAKLDKDGSAGPDASGDVTGTVSDVKLGASNVIIKLDTVVN